MAPEPVSAPPSVLSPGRWVWLWDRDDGWNTVDGPRVAAELRAHGIAGVMPHGQDGARGWMVRNLSALHAAGLAVCASLSWVTSRLILEALAVDVGHLDGGRVMMDWEGWWDGRQKLADQIASEVLDRVDDAAERVTDCPWWAPLYRITASGKHQATHPRAPTKEFGRLASRDRYVQAYGAPTTGRSTRYLEWARHPSQYASLGHWSIRPAHQLYARTLNDQIDTLLREPTVCLWSWLEADSNAKRALRVVAKLEALGFSGPDAVRAFQRAHPPLVVDGIVGPRTLAALGVG